MTICYREKQEQRCGGNIRRKEMRYSATMDEVGNLKLKRVVGKSFLQKNKMVAGLSPAEIKDAKPA